MTALVVHVGTHGTGWAAMQRQLVSWRDALDGAGVRLHPGRQPDSWLTDTFELARGTAPDAIESAAEAAVRDRAAMLLLSSERVEDGLRDADQVANLVEFANRHDMPLTVVVVVRDQLGALNELYCDRVVHLQMARGFPSFAADPSPAERFDYSTAFAALLAHPEVALVAVRHSSLRLGAEAKALLTAAGLDDKEVGALPTEAPGRRLPGPYQVAAARLMFKRLWRLGITTKVPRSRIAEAAVALERHAIAAKWDDRPYWGWDRASRAAAVTQYRAGNDALARAVWGRDWGDVWERHDFTEVDLASSEPRLVVDILTTVDTLVKELQPPDQPVSEE